MSAASAFSWQGWAQGSLPVLEPHSQIKLNVIRDYVSLYINILCSDSFGVNCFKLTLVDGFAGGGVYRDGEKGSPFVLMEAVEEAEVRINSLGARRTPIKIDAHFYFVESAPDAFDCLCQQFAHSRFKERLNKSIFLLRGKFQDQQTVIVDKTKERHPRGGQRVIFLLDQCGYTEVRPDLLRSISERLGGKAEFIINIAFRWLTAHLHDAQKSQSVLANMGLDEVLNLKELVRIKNEKHFNWAYLIESKIGPAFWKVSGLPYFSPFYIEPEGSSRGYWLLHLAPHSRARSAMADIHWKNANGSLHYGNAGLKMLTFKPESDISGYMDGLRFNDVTRERSKVALQSDIARQICDEYPDGIQVEELVRINSNETIANNSMFLEVVCDLVSDHQIVISGKNGGSKRSNKVDPQDVVRPCLQKYFF